MTDPQVWRMTDIERFNIDDPQTDQERFISGLVKKLERETFRHVEENVSSDKIFMDDFLDLRNAILGYATNMISSMAMQFAESGHHDTRKSFLANTRELFNHYMDEIEHDD